MVGIMTLHRTTIGKKVIMAVTGLIWIGYLVMHMYGNLKIFGGAAHFNEYAEGLRELGKPLFGHGHVLWLARIIFITSIFGHVWAAVTLTQRNKASRDVKYAKKTSLQANPATKTMVFGGLAIILFIIYHLMHFTFGIPGVHPSFDPGEPFNNVVLGFQSYSYIPVVIYLLALLALSFHLYHGVWSVFQTLGFNNKNYSSMFRSLALLVAIAIPLGYAAVPISIILGIITLTQ